MSADIREDEVRRAWQAQAGQPGIPTPVELANRITRLTRKTRVRNYGGLVACAIVLAGAIWWLSLALNVLAQAGASLTIVAVGILSWQLLGNRRATENALRDATSGTTPSLVFHRDELRRQRDFHQGWRLWTRLLFLLVGPLMFLAGFARAQPHLVGTIRLEAIVVVVMAIAAAPLNLRIARGYQRQLDELDQLEH